MEPDYHAHYSCSWCHCLRAKGDIIFCDEKPICRHGDCKERHYAKTRPHSWLAPVDDRSCDV